MSTGCRTEGCTVGDTGICLLAHDPNECEFRINDAEPPAAADETEYLPPVLETPEERPTLWGSLSLGLEDLRELMALRRCLFVGIVGTPAAGKTAALVSLYLLLSHGKLDGYQFADSRTLMAFEEISQGARQWARAPPDEMTVHTELSDGRVAGFLHIRVKHRPDGQLIDLVVPDLPGEWSDSLIDTNRTDRLDFLRSTDVIWLFVDGAELRQSDRRMHTLSRTRLLLRRVVTMIGSSTLPVKLVVTHADMGKLPEKTMNSLVSICEEAALDTEILEIASFSSDQKIAPGSGIAKMISSSLPVAVSPPAIWPVSWDQTSGRFMLRYTEATEGA